jgi:hypothetical protein
MGTIMPPKRYVWLVEVGWIADHAQRQLVARLSSDVCELWSWRKGGRVAEVALDGLLGQCWVVPDADDVRRLARAAGRLFAAQSRLYEAGARGAHPALIYFLHKMYAHYEDTWDSILGGKLDAAGVADVVREGLALVRTAMDELPRSRHGLLQSIAHQYATIEKQTRERLDLPDCRLLSMRSVLNVPRPFSEAILNVSSLEELRSSLPPFTNELGAEDWRAFRLEQRKLAQLIRDHDPQEPIGDAFNRANQVLVETTAGCIQLATDFGWSLQRIAATSERPMLDCVQLFGEAANGKTRLFSPIRVQVIPGLFGLAYLDAGRRQESCCPDCGTHTTPGRRGPRNVLCRQCSTIRRQRSYRLKGM